MTAIPLQRWLYASRAYVSLDRDIDKNASRCSPINWPPKPICFVSDSSWLTSSRWDQTAGSDSAAIGFPKASSAHRKPNEHVILPKDQSQPCSGIKWRYGATGLCFYEVFPPGNLASGTLGERWVFW
ncbi:hypothetical protein TARUN_2734 [Trichoderma arundinaceum]|uniref:Uncharacterized protein n=1 Tax=Trichoderma arundinaceum TaxID=490622 RepID=A0A395NTT0_TRIAR|nr:hypothetical protein TARUN_2734 [Trichoderma arundinaceum]